MVHILVGLQAFVLFDFNRPGFADLAQVVPQQIHDHGEFRVILGAGRQLPAQGLVFLRRAAPGSGTLDGPGLQVVSLAEQKTFHGSGEHLKIPTIQVGVKRCGVQVKQAPKETIRLAPKRKGKALG